jgi:hypothetical protein
MVVKSNTDYVALLWYDMIEGSVRLYVRSDNKLQPRLNSGGQLTFQLFYSLLIVFLYFPTLLI